MARGHGPGRDAGRPGYLGPSAPPVAVPAWKRRLYIDRPADLRALAIDITSSTVLAIDAEFVQARTRVPGQPAHRLALLQLAIDNDYRTSYVVDTLRLSDLSPLGEPLEHPGILKLFHGISADARMLATRGLEARHYLDLEAVSRSIFGQRESGLQAMLQRAANVRIDKSLQRADWARRPLTPAMVAYAARDAEMTYVLYGWLASNYAWATALHEIPADEQPPQGAVWIRSLINGGRGRAIEVAVAEAGLAGNVKAQERDVRAALQAAVHPGQRTRVMRIAAELGLKGLAVDLRPYLGSLASDERGGAARALGRLRDEVSAHDIRALLNDPVEDVRQAAQMAQMALDGRNGAQAELAGNGVRDAAPTGAKRWTFGDVEEEQATGGDWRAALRQQFGAAREDGEPEQ